MIVKVIVNWNSIINGCIQDFSLLLTWELCWSTTMIQWQTEINRWHKYNGLPKIQQADGDPEPKSCIRIKDKYQITPNLDIFISQYANCIKWGIYHKTVLGEHPSDIFWEALRAFLAINCSMQRQHQLHKDQALSGLVKPAISKYCQCL